MWQYNLVLGEDNRLANLINVEVSDKSTFIEQQDDDHEFGRADVNLKMFKDQVGPGRFAL